MTRLAFRSSPGASAWPRRPLDLPLAQPRLVLLIAAAVLVFAAAGLRGLVKDPSVDAFVPQDHPAALAREMAREVFGLEDPVVVALAVNEGGSAFTPAILTALRDIHEAVRLVPGVKKRDVISLASENAISGSAGDLNVDPILEPGPVTPESAALAGKRARSMPMLMDLLAAGDGDMLTLIVPVADPNHAESQVRTITEIATAKAPPGVDVHVAGVAAMNARLAQMVDGDTKIFIPAAVVTVLVILLVALHRWQALLGPLTVIAGSAAVAMGAMGWAGSRYYLITTALPVVIMAIAVADSVHISTFYLRLRGRDPTLSATRAARDAIHRTWLPVTLTTVTTVAGFLGLAFGAGMRPISEFGVYASVGVVAAWCLSLTVLPAVLVLTDLQPRVSAGPYRDASPARVDAAIRWLTRRAHERPRLMLAFGACVSAVLAVAALRADFDYERKRYFAPGDAVRIADAVVNERLGGVNFLDVVVSSRDSGGLMTPAAMHAIRDLRSQIAGLAHVAKVSAIDEYLGVMHAALTGASPQALPQQPDAPAQYMLLYEASAAPDDFRQEIDYDYRRALVRAQLDTDRFSLTRPIVERLEERVSAWSRRSGLEAEVSGRVAVNHGWMSSLAHNHFNGLALAGVLVFAAAALTFRSASAAALAMMPVLTGILFVYAMMGAFAIDIAPATSMTAAIATGLGVDFGIHLIAHVRRHRRAGAALDAALGEDYAVVGRACIYSALALGCALAVVCLSSAPPLRWFGMLVSAGAFGSLFGALVFVPAAAALSSHGAHGSADGDVHHG